MSLASQLNAFISALGLDIHDLQNYKALSEFNAALRRRESRRCNIVVLGNSLVEGFPVTSYDLTVPQQLVAGLRTRFPTSGSTTGGRGFVPIPTAGVTLPSPWTISGGSRDPSNVGVAEVFHLGPSRNVWYTNGTGTATYLCGSDATSIDLHHIKGASGHATGGYYKINGGTAVTFSTLDAVGAVANLRITVPAGASVEFGCNASSGYVIIAGVQEHASDELKGIQVHNCGHSGYTAALWTANPTTIAGWRDSLALLNPDVMVIVLGANDADSAGSNRTPAQLGSDITSLISTIRAGSSPLTNVPIVLVAEYNVTGPGSGNGKTFSSAWANHVAAIKAVADADTTVEFLDLNMHMPPTLSESKGLYYTDNVHGAADGSAYEWMAQLIGGRITPSGQDWLPGSGYGTKGSALPAATSYANADELLGVQGGVTKRVASSLVRRNIPYEVHLFSSGSNAGVAGVASAAAGAEMFSTGRNTRHKIDLSQATQFRLTGVVTAIGNAATAAIKMTYMTTNAATWVGIDLTGTGATLVVGAATANTIVDSGWLDLATGAKVNDLYVACSVAVAFGTTAPSFANLKVYYR